MEVGAPSDRRIHTLRVRSLEVLTLICGLLDLAVCFVGDVYFSGCLFMVQSQEGKRRPYKALKISELRAVGHRY